MPNLKTFFPEGVKIKIGNEDFIVKPFVLRTRTEVLRIITEICLDVAREMPAIGKSMNPKDMDIQKLPVFIQLAGDKLIDIYVIVLGKDKEWLLDNVQLSDEIEIIQAIVKVNDIPFFVVPDKNAIRDGQDADEALVEILGLLARECGWSHDYIADNFTVQQIRAYYETINKQKMREQQLGAICMVYATATAFGSMKFTDFRKFLDKFERSKKSDKDTIEEMKRAGLPIEDK